MSEAMLVPVLISVAVALCALAGLAVGALGDRRANARHRRNRPTHNPRPAPHLRRAESLWPEDDHVIDGRDLRR